MASPDPQPRERERRRIECLGVRGEAVTVLELQYYHLEETASGIRHHPGARRFQIPDGRALRLVDARTFEVIDTGELLRQVEAVDARGG